MTEPTNPHAQEDKIAALDSYLAMLFNLKCSTCIESIRQHINWCTLKAFTRAQMKVMQTPCYANVVHTLHTDIGDIGRKERWMSIRIGGRCAESLQCCGRRQT